MARPPDFETAILQPGNLPAARPHPCAAERRAQRHQPRAALRAALEASGDITLDNVHSVAETGGDYLSVETITKNVEAVDLALEFDA